MKLLPLAASLALSIALAGCTDGTYAVPSRAVTADIAASRIGSASLMRNEAVDFRDNDRWSGR